jgi:hypothetical protein
MKLYLSFDLESWAYPDEKRFRELSSKERKKLDNGFVVESIKEVLNLLKHYKRTATFFCLGELFEWYPEELQKIRQAGHEIAYHSHRHAKITSHGIMEDELSRSKPFIDYFKPSGFRAPQIYLTQEALKPLAGKGFRYSSSIYGSWADYVESGDSGLREFPVSTYNFRHNQGRRLEYPRDLKGIALNEELPFGSGYFLALLPFRFIAGMVSEYLRLGKDVFAFVHNWQITAPKNAEFPGLAYKIAHPQYFPYTLNIEKKVARLIERFDTGRMDELL